MRSMQRTLALTVGILAASVPGVSSAGWKFEENGPRFAHRDQRSSTVAEPERVSLAPKLSVAEMRSFDRYGGGTAPRGISGLKPSLDRYWANQSRRPSASSSIAVDID